MANDLRAAPRIPTQESATPPQIDALDGLRAIAALMVLTTHVAFHTALVTRPVIGEITSRLDFGVCLFFFLSGFLLYRPWASAANRGTKGPDLRRYLRRRFARVYPAYFVVVVVVLAAYGPSRTSEWDVWARYLTLTQVYAEGYERQGLTQMWSLSMEVAFYLALPALAFAAASHWPARIRTARRQLLLLGSMVLASLTFNVARGWTDLLPDTIAGFWLPAHLDWFAGGMLLAVVNVSRDAADPGPRWFGRMLVAAEDWPTWLALAAGLFVLALTPLAGPLTPFDPITSFATGPWYILFKEALYGLCAFALMVPLVLSQNASPYSRLLSHRASRWLGHISYGIFLWHLVLLGALSSVLGIEIFQGWFWLLWPLTTVVTVAVAWLSWTLLEKRLIRWSTASSPPGRRPPLRRRMRRR